MLWRCLLLKYRPIPWSFKNLCQAWNLNSDQFPLLTGELFYDIQSQAEFCSKGSLFLPHEDNIDELVEAKEALRNDAAAVVASKNLGNFASQAPIIEVPCRKEALIRLAYLARDSFPGTMIAVTGSTGKTTTKDILHHALSHIGPCHATYLNRNVGLDVALAVAQVPRSAKFSVIEVGSGWPNCIAEKNIYVKPDIGIITNVGYSHYEYYSGIEDILTEKLSLLNDLTGERIAIMSRSVYDMDKESFNLVREKNIKLLVTVGSSSKDTVRLMETELHTTKVSVKVKIDNKNYSYDIKYPAPHFACNALFALAVAYVLELDIQTIASSLSSFQGLDRRVERFRVDAGGLGNIIELIHDAYNASQDSTRALIKILNDREKPNRRVLIFGDILELGDDCLRLHEELADDIANSRIDLLITVGPNSKHVASLVNTHIDTHSFPDSDLARSRIIDLINHGDLVAVKGSNGMSLDKIVKRLTGKGMFKIPASPEWTIEGETF